MITIKQVQTEQDYQTCLEIRRTVFIEEQNVPAEKEVDAFEKDSIHFLALVDKKPAATGRMRIKKSFIKFERIATLPAYRRQGIASKMLLKMQEVAQQDYPSYLMAMHAQKDAIPFYLKLGWIALGEIFYEAGIPHQLMIFPPKNTADLKCLTDPTTPPTILNYLKEL